MSESHNGPRCGAGLPPGTPGGHCIACLLQLGLEPSESVTDRPKTATANLPTEKPGDKIGRYKLLQQIGEGGCGVVYMAEQEEPVRRREALKVIKLGMDTKQVIARFEAERQFYDHLADDCFHAGRRLDKLHLHRPCVERRRVHEHC